MYRKILSLALIISLDSFSALPPTSLSGQSQTTKPTTFTFKTPYNQSTQIGGIESMIETGSENMLVNPGFEGVGTSGWTCTSGTCTKTTTAGEFSSGKAALKVALSAQALNVSQSISTPTGIQVQGVVGVIYKVPSAITDFQVCSLVNAVEQTCVPAGNLIVDNLYHSIEIPTTMTAGSSIGIKFKTTATYTQNVFFDGAYVKQGMTTGNIVNGTEVVTIQKFTSGSGTYTPTVGTLKIRVRMSGGGGGGGSTGSQSAASTNGGISTFGTSLLTAGGGYGGNWQDAGALSDVPIVSAPAISVVAVRGSGGGGPISHTTVANTGGAAGGVNPFGGSGGGAYAAGVTGKSGAVNTGSGGGAGGGNASLGGGGGGAGAYIDAIIMSPAASYLYSVGGAGTGGTGTANGGAGGTGVIIIEEYSAPASAAVYSAASANYSEKNDGVITIDAVTTPPTKGTATIDKMTTSRYGNRAVIVYSYRQAAGGSAGSGEYLFSLPAGLTFDSSIVPDNTAALYSSDAKVAAFVGVGQTGNTNQGICSLFAYSTTQFRAICGNNAAGTAQGFNTIGSATFLPLSASVFYSFTVNVPIAGWSNSNVIVGSISQKAPTVQTFTSGSGTYTTPSGIAYIKVRMVGGGGGGGGSGTAGGTAGGNGVASTFGTSLLNCNGGTGGQVSGGIGGSGGTSSLGTGPIGSIFTGGSGGGSINASTEERGAAGGETILNGGGNISRSGQPGNSAITNSGSGGGGAGGNAVSLTTGAGGGAGGSIDAIINSPLTSYSYTVGTAGGAGTAGTSGNAGGAGGSGYIEVTEFYKVGTY